MEWGINYVLRWICIPITIMEPYMKIKILSSTKQEWLLYGTWKKKETLQYIYNIAKHPIQVQYKLEILLTISRKSSLPVIEWKLGDRYQIYLGSIIECELHNTDIETNYPLNKYTLQFVHQIRTDL